MNNIFWMNIKIIIGKHIRDLKLLHNWNQNEFLNNCQFNLFWKKKLKCHKKYYQNIKKK